MKPASGLFLAMLIAGCTPTLQTTDTRQIAASPASMQQVSDDCGCSQTVRVGSLGVGPG